MGYRSIPRGDDLAVIQQTIMANGPRQKIGDMTVEHSFTLSGGPTDRIVGQSPAIMALRMQIRHLAAFDAVGNPYAPTLLLQGETGTGKGLVARVVHDSGPRANGPLIEVNRAAIPDTMLEAELFGFEPGAFTDAKRSKLGLFEAASGGTLFLDEIDALPLGLQSKLLNVLEAKRIRRLGAVVDRPVDVKLIAATNADLSRYVSMGRFRADLYHRLAVVLLRVPPLRERGDDCLVLAHHLLRRYAEIHGLHPKRLSRPAEAWIRSHSWPGNVRELSHLIERVTLLSPETILDPRTLERLCLPRPEPSPVAMSEPHNSEPQPLDEASKIRQAIMQAEGNVVRVARLLGLSRGALRYRMQRYSIAHPRLRKRPQLQETPPEEPSWPVAALAGGVDSDIPPLPEGGQSTPSQGESRPEASWEYRPVAVLAISVMFPAAEQSERPRHDLRALAAVWERRIVEKATGFGGILLQRSPALLLVAFGSPRTLERLPDRAVQAALAIRHVVAEATATDLREPSPEVRLAVHMGTVLVDIQPADPTTPMLSVGETLTLPIHLLGHAAPMDLLLSSQIGRLVENWYILEERALPLLAGGQDQYKAYAVVELRSHLAS